MVHRPEWGFADALGLMPELVMRLLADHRADATGRRCVACTTAGTGSPGASWPCEIRNVAETAHRRSLLGEGKSA